MQESSLMCLSQSPKAPNSPPLTLDSVDNLPFSDKDSLRGHHPPPHSPPISYGAWTDDRGSVCIQRLTFIITFHILSFFVCLFKFVIGQSSVVKTQ